MDETKHFVNVTNVQVSAADERGTDAVGTVWKCRSHSVGPHSSPGAVHSRTGGPASFTRNESLLKIISFRALARCVCYQAACEGGQNLTPLLDLPDPSNTQSTGGHGALKAYRTPPAGAKEFFGEAEFRAQPPVQLSDCA